MSETATTEATIAFARDYPRWDERHANTLVSTDDVAVDVDIEPNEDGSQLIIRRTVWSCAYRRGAARARNGGLTDGQHHDRPRRRPLGDLS